MFALLPGQPIQTAILELLSVSPEMSLSEMHAKLKTGHGVRISLQHLYRVIGEMIEGKQLIKVKTKVSVNLMWIAYVELAARRVKERMIASSLDSDDLPQRDGGHKQYTADSLLELEAIWSHLLVQIDALSKTKEWYAYNSHALLHPAKGGLDLSTYRDISARGITCCLLYGNDTALDRAALAQVQTLPGFRAAISTDTPFPREGYTLNVSGDYMLDCVFPESVTKHLQMLFASTTPDSTIDPQLFASIFSLKGTCQITVRKNSLQAKGLREKIKMFF